MTDTAEQTYVHEGKEWVLTGRTAQKVVFHSRDVNRKIGTMTMVEIAPNDSLGRNAPEFYKWVNPRDLFFISEMKEIDIKVLRDENMDDE